MGQLLDMMDQPHTLLLLRLVLGGLLLLAATTKLMDRQGFRQAVAEYGILPEKLEGPFAALLPWLETTLGTLLLLGLGTTVAAALAVPLFLSFGLAIGVNVLRGRRFDCHCFGTAQSDRIGWPALLRSAALVLMALLVSLGASPYGSLDQVIFNSNVHLPPAGEIIPVVFLAAVVFDVLVLLPEALAFQTGFARAYETRATHTRHRGDHRTATTLEASKAS